MLNLYDYFRSTACFRVRIALNLKALTYEKIPIHLLNQGGEQFFAEYQAINPQNLVPTLKTQEKLITQSMAIIEYLEETYPSPSLFANKDPYQKALIRSFALTIVADMHPLNNLRVLKYLSDEFQINDQQKSKWYQHWMQKGLVALETQLHSYHDKTAHDFCFGDQPTLADICLIPQLFNAKRFSCDLTPYPTLRRIDQYCQTIPAFIQAAPQST